MTMKKNKLNKKQLFLLISLILVIITAAIVGSKYWRDQSAKKKSFANRDKQQQIMLDFWREQGLSEEEIEKRLATQPQGKSRPEMTDEERADREEKMKEVGFEPGQVRGVYRIMH